MSAVHPNTVPSVSRNRIIARCTLGLALFLGALVCMPWLPQAVVCGVTRDPSQCSSAGALLARDAVAHDVVVAFGGSAVANSCASNPGAPFCWGVATTEIRRRARKLREFDPSRPWWFLPEAVLWRVTLEQSPEVRGELEWLSEALGATCVPNDPSWRSLAARYRRGCAIASANETTVLCSLFGLPIEFPDFISCDAFDDLVRPGTLDISTFRQCLWTVSTVPSSGSIFENVCRSILLRPANARRPFAWLRMQTLVIQLMQLRGTLHP